MSSRSPFNGSPTPVSWTGLPAASPWPNGPRQRLYRRR